MHAHNWFITLFSLYIVLNLWHLSRVPLEERQQYPLLEWRCGNEGKRNGNNNNVKIPQERKKNMFLSDRAGYSISVSPENIPRHSCAKGGRRHTPVPILRHFLWLSVSGFIRVGQFPANLSSR